VERAYLKVEVLKAQTEFILAAEFLCLETFSLYTNCKGGRANELSNFTIYGGKGGSQKVWLAPRGML